MTSTIEGTRRHARVGPAVASIGGVTTTGVRGLLIAAEGLDGSGKSAGLEALGRWLERKGRRVHLLPWERSRQVARAVAAPRGRQVLTPRVAALMAAADAADRLAQEVRGPIQRGDIVLADRYAWTAVAREIARGLEPPWASALYRFAPRPDLVLFHRQEPRAALARALATRPSSLGAEAVGVAYADFLERLMAAYEWLLSGSSDDPWGTSVLVLDPTTMLSVRETAVHDAIRPMLDGRSGLAAGA